MLILVGGFCFCFLWGGFFCFKLQANVLIGNVLEAGVRMLGQHDPPTRDSGGTGGPPDLEWKTASPPSSPNK